jgi:hypothetical protein
MVGMREIQPMDYQPDYYLTVTYKPSSKVLELKYRKSEPVRMMNDKDARIWAARMSEGLGPDYEVTLVKDGVLLANFDQLI